MGFMKKLEKMAVAKAGTTAAGGQVTPMTERETLSKVGSLAEAQARVPFAVREPQGLGMPQMIAATAADQNTGKRAVLFRYDDPSLGALSVLERAGDDIVTIRGDIQATIMASETGSMVRWVENGVSFTVMAERGTRDEVLAAIERI